MENSISGCQVRHWLGEKLIEPLWETGGSAILRVVRGPKPPAPPGKPGVWWGVGDLFSGHWYFRFLITTSAKAVSRQLLRSLCYLHGGLSHRPAYETLSISGKAL